MCKTVSSEAQVCACLNCGSRYNKQTDRLLAPRWTNVVCIPSHQQSFVSKSISHGPLQVTYDNAVAPDAVHEATRVAARTGFCA